MVSLYVTLVSTHMPVIPQCIDCSIDLSDPQTYWHSHLLLGALRVTEKEASACQTLFPARQFIQKEELLKILQVGQVVEEVILKEGPFSVLSSSSDGASKLSTVRRLTSERLRRWRNGEVPCQCHLHFGSVPAGFSFGML